ncbi:methyl-accepting chemotaxis protein [Aneurinibacillus tyrosinisolvens]|uniref:methyl-accepting chemotaxis protein n=1 Tax=Aneurinibacillus tyrosinisolvens TaxID=1443435 RepID=UPI00063EFE52|nr:methyl-accepting chemotaxis protein [Aneurinibacillus tyrosinisolvens]
MSSVKSKLISIILVSIMFPTLILGLLSYSSTRNALIESGMTDLWNITNNSYNSAVALNDQVKKGKITKEEAQSEMQLLLVGPRNSDGTRDLSKSTVKVGTTGYIFAQNSNGVLTMHPKSEGKSIWDTQGGVGKLIAEKKNGIVHYAWKNPGEDHARDKIVVLKYFEPWDWIIAVGSYDEEFYSAANDIKIHMYITLAIEFIVGFILAWFMGNRLTNPLVSIGTLMEQLGQGNLKNRLEFTKRRDEYGTLAHHFNQALDNLSDLIRKVNDTSVQVAASSEELTASAEQSVKATELIATSIEQVASGTETQTENTEQSARAMEEMSKGIQRIAENCFVVSEASNGTAELAETGGQSIQKVVRQMNSIQKSVNDSDATINQLFDHSQEIEKILGVITGIADQTNLLALNAAIEAARAGEYGRGFAVVADEVRKLAEQSSVSAGQITNIITKIQSDTKISVDVMDQVKKEVGSGIDVAYETERNFTEILHSMKRVADQIQDMSAIAQQMSAGTEQVSASISHIAQVSRGTSASSQNAAVFAEKQLAPMEEITSSAAALSKMAEELSNLLGKFKV